LAIPETVSSVWIDSLQAWLLVLQDIRACGICGLDLETTGSDPFTSRIRLAKLALPDGRICMADVFELGKRILDDLAALMEDGQVKKVIHNAKSDLSVIRASHGRRLKFKNVFDLMLASQVCWSGYYDLVLSNSPKNPWKKKLPDHSLKALAERHLGIALAKSDLTWDWNAEDLAPEQIDYACKDVSVLLSLHSILQDLIIKNGLERVAELEFETISPIVEMELSGIYLDSNAAKELIADYETKLIKVFMDLQDEAKANDFVPLLGEEGYKGYYLNPESQAEVKRYLCSLGFNIASTKADVLKELTAEGCVFAEMLLKYRRISHLLAFLDSWLKLIHAVDGRIHPQYFQIQAATGRLSSRKPNAQQIPRRGEEGMAVRRLFKAPPGKKVVKADFSAIELRIMAYLSGDETMQEALQKGYDLHKLTASRICGLPLDQVTDPQRQAAKTINFLLIYGGSAETLQWRALSDYGAVMCLDEACEMRDKFFETYSGVKAWHEKQIIEMSYTHQHYFHDCVHGTFALPLTCTFTALGRKRVWPRFGTGIRASKFQLYNTPCQGTGADLIKLVMCELYKRLDSEDAKIIGSIHDEILLEVPEDKAEEYAKMLCEVMNSIGSELLNPVPVTSEAEILSSWGG